MITRINEHTIRLEPDPPKRRVAQRPRRPLNATERKLADMAANAIKDALAGEFWLRKQIRRSDDYMHWLNAGGAIKTGVAGYICAPNAKVMLRPEEALRWVRKT